MTPCAVGVVLWAILWHWLQFCRSSRIEGASAIRRLRGDGTMLLVFLSWPCWSYSTLTRFGEPKLLSSEIQFYFIYTHFISTIVTSINQLKAPKKDNRAAELKFALRLCYLSVFIEQAKPILQLSVQHVHDKSLDFGHWASTLVCSQRVPLAPNTMYILLFLKSIVPGIHCSLICRMASTRMR